MQEGCVVLDYWTIIGLGLNLYRTENGNHHESVQEGWVVLVVLDYWTIVGLKGEVIPYKSAYTKSMIETRFIVNNYPVYSFISSLTEQTH